MNRIQADEYVLTGGWSSSSGGVRGDEVSERIEWLISNVLEKIADSPTWGAWETLFRDPGDGRLWERTFPRGEAQGGGPPQLSVIEADRALQKYGTVGRHDDSRQR